MMKALIGMGKIIVAIDSFKGCLTSAEANRAAAESILSQMPEAEVIQIPVSDGGEGWLEAVLSAMGGRMQDVLVNDPLMRPIVAQYLINGDTAVIEMAKAIRPKYILFENVTMQQHTKIAINTAIKINDPTTAHDTNVQIFP